MSPLLIIGDVSLLFFSLIKIVSSIFLLWIFGSSVISFSDFFNDISASFIKFSVFFGTSSDGFWVSEPKTVSNKSPFETLSPILTFNFSILPSIVDGISTLDLSLSIVTIGSFFLFLDPL